MPIYVKFNSKHPIILYETLIKSIENLLCWLLVYQLCHRLASIIDQFLYASKFSVL